MKDSLYKTFLENEKKHLFENILLNLTKPRSRKPSQIYLLWQAT